MIASLPLLTSLVMVGLVMTACAPIVLLCLLMVDYKKGELW